MFVLRLQNGLRPGATFIPTLGCTAIVTLQAWFAALEFKYHLINQCIVDTY